MTHLLSILLLIPTAGGVVVLFLPTRAIRWTALGIAIFTCLFSLLLLFRFNVHANGGFEQGAGNTTIQLVERAPWIARFHIDYVVGIDGLSIPLLLLTTFIFPIAVVASWKIERSARFYLALLLLLESAIIGTFIALDGVLFCAFFQLSLMPAYLLLGFWGGPRKEHAALKFFLYMIVGSVVMLTALILIYLNLHSFNLVELPSLAAARFSASRSFSRLSPFLFLLVLLGCCIKSALVPLHSWLADACVEAPAPLSMVLSAVMLKVGTYAMFRIAYPLFPEAAKHLWLVIALVGLGSILYGALCAMGQADFKRLVTFGSISQMGFVLLGAAMLTTASLNGALFMMIAHGVIVATMFFIVEIIASRAGHRDLTLLGGLATTMPRFWGFSAAGFFAGIGMPGFCLFVAEILIFLGTFAALRSDSILRAGSHARRGTICALVIFALIGLMITAGYTLWALQRIFFGPERPEQAKFADIDDRETTVLALLAGMAVLLGVFPGVFFFPMTGGAVDAMLRWIDPPSIASQVTPDVRVQPASD